MEDFIKVGLVVGFPNDFMVNMDLRRVLKDPFPSHIWKVRGETHYVHNISTHVGRGHGPSSNIMIASVG